MITITDLFCGAGGSSTGAIQVPGVKVRMAANHWKLAIETHLWASPECTNHSVARGKKRADSTPDLFGEVLPDAAAERSRATMWDVPRFAEYHRYAAVIIENVVESLGGAA